MLERKVHHSSKIETVQFVGSMVVIRKKDDLLLITSATHIFIVDINTGINRRVQLPDPILDPHLTPGQTLILTKESRSVVSCEVSNSGKYVAVSLENKQVVILDSHFNPIRNFIIPRVASKVCFGPSDDLVIADKTGDVILYPHDENKKPILLLGHLSVILDMTFSDCGKFIITCDRDEKIRVSHFPNAYNVASFCLGHTEFVINIKVYGDTLISASGDGTIRFWDFKTGTQLDMINTNDNVGEKHLLDSFSKQMDNEKVEVTALPITNMQTCEIKSTLFIAASLYNLDYLLLYTFEKDSRKYSFFKSIKTSFPYDFYFDTYLYVFSNNCFKECNVVSDSDLNEGRMHELNSKCSSYFKNTFSSEFLMLYKRKFDNVQEYLEKKKMRINK